MNYKPAQLDGQLLARLQQFESDLRKQTASNIVLIAYQTTGEDADNGAAAGGK
ncbi:hypothetical protein [Paenibacillus sp. CF384]|uniref:hypothetical protein n=1 Tax=Paenibacillus sp. CF384 TaxID=1884382 RepID=UPI00089B98CD|nr:hypothetical protein [Paenibacillus sp. CF384]SDX32456.1 hypothetical protein SAMN05518855_101256 [Paenibacillus sp. CF384]